MRSGFLKSRGLAIVAVLTLGVIAAYLYPSIRVGASARPAIGSASYPSKLSDNTGPSAVIGLQLVSSSSNPLWNGKDGNGPYTPSELGLVGGLEQLWVSNAAIRQYGPVGVNGTQLPLSADFVKAHQGVLDVYVHILKFDNTRSPSTILRSPAYKPSSIGLTPVTAVTISNGRAYTFPYGNGEVGFMFQWPEGQYWNSITVVGNGISVGEAEQVAKSLKE